MIKLVTLVYYINWYYYYCNVNNTPTKSFAVDNKVMIAISIVTKNLLINVIILLFFQFSWSSLLSFISSVLRLSILPRFIVFSFYSYVRIHVSVVCSLHPGFILFSLYSRLALFPLMPESRTKKENRRERMKELGKRKREKEDVIKMKRVQTITFSDRRMTWLVEFCRREWNSCEWKMGDKNVKGDRREWKRKRGIKTKRGGRRRERGRGRGGRTDWPLLPEVSPYFCNLIPPPLSHSLQPPPRLSCPSPPPSSLLSPLPQLVYGLI